MNSALQKLRDLAENSDGEYGFAGGTSSDDLDSISNEFGVTLPTDYRQFLIETGGEAPNSDGLCGGYQFLGVEEIRSTHMEWCGYAQAEFASLRTTTWYLGETAFYEPTWFPIAAIRQRELIMLATDHTRCCVFEWDVESGAGAIYAYGFSMMINRIVDSLLDEGYVEMIDSLEPLRKNAE